MFSRFLVLCFVAVAHSSQEQRLRIRSGKRRSPILELNQQQVGNSAHPRQTSAPRQIVRVLSNFRNVFWEKGVFEGRVLCKNDGDRSANIEAIESSCVARRLFLFQSGNGCSGAV